MSGKKRKRPSAVPAPQAPLDPETGLPAVGRGTPREPERVLRRAREKHAHRQRLK